uniref:Uncharacterized protein n=1 Tax=Opuntia streptacantha TaxID=393608 RepID=A0A7C8ZKE6_OPUST
MIPWGRDHGRPIGHNHRWPSVHHGMWLLVHPVSISAVHSLLVHHHGHVLLLLRIISIWAHRWAHSRVICPTTIYHGLGRWHVVAHWVAHYRNTVLPTIFAMINGITFKIITPTTSSFFASFALVIVISSSIIGNFTLVIYVSTTMAFPHFALMTTTPLLTAAA